MPIFKSWLCFPLSTGVKFIAIIYIIVSVVVFGVSFGDGFRQKIVEQYEATVGHDLNPPDGVSRSTIVTTLAIILRLSYIADVIISGLMIYGAHVVRTTSKDIRIFSIWINLKTVYNFWLFSFPVEKDLPAVAVFYNSPIALCRLFSANVYWQTIFLPCFR